MWFALGKQYTAVQRRAEDRTVSLVKVIYPIGTNLAPELKKTARTTAHRWALRVFV